MDSTTHELTVEPPGRAKHETEHRESQSGSAPSLQRSLHPVLQLQHVVGNRRVGQLIQAGQLTPHGKILGIQRKLTVGEANDQYEQEAERVAERVMRMPEQPSAGTIASSALPGLRRKCSCGGTCTRCSSEHDESEIQREPAGSGNSGLTAPPSVQEVLGSPGRPLDAATRSFMEPRLQRDFSAVRVHTDGAAGQSARELSANAYTVGENIVFGAGRFAPDTSEGRHLIAHELTHVIQQGGGGPLVQRAPAGGVALDVATDQTIGPNVVQRSPAAAQGVAPKLTKKPRVVLTVVPPRAMSGREFAILALAQLYAVGLDEAESILNQMLEGGGKLIGHFDTGISEDQKGRPVTVGIELLRVGEDEIRDAKDRAQELADLPEDERHRIDDEADRRYWRKHGDEAQTRKKKIGPGPGQATERDLWMRTRDEVVRDRDALQNLPDQAREFLRPDGRDLDPEQYAAALRIATKVNSFTDADWALYQRRGRMTSDNYEEIEQSVDAFLKSQAADRSIIDRLRGTEEIWKTIEAARKNDLILDAAGIMNGPLSKEWETAQAMLPRRFKNLAEYFAARDAYVKLFRERAQEIALQALAASESVVYAELMRYTDKDEVNALHAKLAKLRSLWVTFDYQSHQERAQMRIQDPNPEITALLNEVEEELIAQSADYPILADQELDSHEFTDAGPEQLGGLLRQDAHDRLHDIEKTRARLIHDPEIVFQLDRVLQMTKTELGATPGTIFDMIVDAHLSNIKADHAFKAIATAILAIGLGLLTAGGGTVAVLAGGALLAVSVVTSVEQIKNYGDALAAAHTAFDAEQTLSSDSPSALWAALSLIAIGLDGLQLVAALKAAGPALHVLEETDDVARFAAKLNLAKNEGVLKSIVKARLVARAQALRKEFGEAMTALGRALRSSPARGVMGPTHLLLAHLWEMIPPLARAARVAARMGVRNFETFLLYIGRHPALRGFDIGKLSKDELDAIEWIWRENSGERAATAPARDAPHAPEPAEPEPDIPATRPAAPPPAPTGLPRHPRFIGDLHPSDMRTAGTGGIESIERRINTVDNSQTVTITGEILPAMDRLRAPNYNNEEMWRVLRENHNLPDYQAAHLAGPGFGDEAAAGMMLAPSEVNLVLQNGRAERFLRQDLPALAEAASRRLGRRVSIRYVAVATSHPGTVAGGAALKEVEYTFSAVMDGGEVTLGRIEFSVGLPPAGKVSEVNVTRLGGNW